MTSRDPQVVDVGAKLFTESGKVATHSKSGYGDALEEAPVLHMEERPTGARPHEKL